MSGSARKSKAQRTTVPTLDTAKLCVKCKWENDLDCNHPMLPINLVTGTRVFPAIIARGYDSLCGVTGRYWESSRIHGKTNDTRK